MVEVEVEVDYGDSDESLSGKPGAKVGDQSTGEVVSRSHSRSLTLEPSSESAIYRQSQLQNSTDLTMVC